MSTLTLEFRGVVDNVLKSMVEKGYARTKAEAVRYALLHLGEELGLTKTRIHAKAEEYAYAEIRKR